MAPEQSQVETLEGTVSAVIYQNPENGYTVLRVKSKEGSQTVVGEMADVSPGEHILATGIWVDHPSFGPQFKAVAMETSVPTETQGIFEYLAAGVIKGVGKQTARRRGIKPEAQEIQRFAGCCAGDDLMQVIASSVLITARQAGHQGGWGVLRMQGPRCQCVTEPLRQGFQLRQ